MKSYIIPSKRHDNDLVILHFGTNSLRENKSEEEIATEIIDLAIEMKTTSNEDDIEYSTQKLLLKYIANQN